MLSIVFTITRTRQTLASLLLVMLVSGCSTGKLVVRGAMPLMDGGFEAMNRETDLQLARDAIPATLMMLEGMAVEDPGNVQLHMYLAQGYYGYSYSFVEQTSAERAVNMYTRCLEHTKAALIEQNFKTDAETAPLAELDQALSAATTRHVPALFWTASCLAKRTDMFRTDPRSIAQLARAASLMTRVMDLDEKFYYGGPHLFFGVYYGGRAPMFGGDYEKSEQHFTQARAINDGKLLLGDVLYAEFLARQTLDREAFHQHLTAVIDAPDNQLPEMALANRVAKQRAQLLLNKEAEWF